MRKAMNENGDDPTQGYNYIPVYTYSEASNIHDDLLVTGCKFVN